MLLIFSVIYFAPLAGHQLLEPDEGRYAEIPREMLESGNYITPMLNYVKYFEKPPLLYWLNALSFKVFGENAFAARFPTALSAILGIFTTGLLGAFMFGRRAGTKAAVITGTSLLYYAIGTINITDMLLSFFMTVTAAAFYVGNSLRDRRWYLLAYAAAALGVLTKGLVAVVLPGAAGVAYFCLTRQWRRLPEVFYLPGILLFAAIAVPPFYVICRTNPDFFHLFFIQEHFLRYATKMHHRYEPFWFYLPLIPVAVMPWTGFLFSLFSKRGTLRSPDTSEMRDANIFLLVWLAVLLLFYSASSSKLIPYIVPCIMPITLLMAANSDRMLIRGEMHGGVLGWSIGIWTLFALAAFAYTLIGDDMTPLEDITISAGIAATLLVGAFFAWFYMRRRDYEKAFFSLSIGAILFAFGLQSIYMPLDRTRSVWPVARAVLSEQRPGETIAVYNEVLHGMPFYTKQRVVLVEYEGELGFGANQKEGEGWFPSRAEFLELWRGGEPFVLVVENRRIANLCPDGESGGEKLEVGKYTIFFNRELER